MKSEIYSNEMLVTRAPYSCSLPPLSRLPHEVLGLIFTEASYDSTHFTLSSKSQRRWGPSVISAVCRRWREVAIETPSMWSSLQFTIDSLSFDPPMGVLEALRTHLRRSGNATMSYRIIVGEVKLQRTTQIESEMDGNGTKPTVKAHADVVRTLFSQENAPRIGNLEFYVSPRSRKFISQLMELNDDKTAPVLALAPRPASGSSPSRMSHLTLASPLSAESQPPKYTMIDWDTLAPTFFPNPSSHTTITSLTLEAQLPTVWSALRSLPHLVTASVTLVACRDHVDLLDICPAPIITLDALETLEVWNAHRAARLLETLKAPRLEELFLSARSSRRKDYVVNDFGEEGGHVRERLVGSLIEAVMVEQTKSLRQVVMVDMDFGEGDFVRVEKVLDERQVKLEVVDDTC